MALVPWREENFWGNPFGELEKIQDEMNKLFNFSLARRPYKGLDLLEGAWSPAVDVYDSKDNIIVKADIPGMKKDEISVSVQGNILVIRGEKKHENKTKTGNFIRTERFYGGFNRAISLPAEIDPAKVSANYKEGVLELTLPKREDSKPKQIAIDVK